MNYGDLKTLVKDYLETDEASFNTHIGQFVRNCEEQISRQVQLQDLMETSTTTIPANNAFVSLPSDFLAAYSIFVQTNLGYQPLFSREQSFMRENFPDTTLRGVPRYYAIFDEDTMMIMPIPDQSYGLEMNYFYKAVSITSGDDTMTTWIGENGGNALLFGTILQGYIYLKGDQDVVKMYQDMFSTAVADLKLIAEGRNRKDTYRQPDRRIPV